MNAPVITPAYAHLLDEGIIEAARAQKHLAEMIPARRAQYEAEWLAAEQINDRARIVADRRAIVEAQS